MATEARKGMLVQTVIKDRATYRALAREARRQQVAVATLLRQVILEYLSARDLLPCRESRLGKRIDWSAVNR